MARLFNAYVIVDWSAASKPATGTDSIWIGVMKRDVRFRFTCESRNPSTRTEAEAALNTILTDLKSRGERVLLGFDFPLGYPAGTPAALKLKDESWAGMWEFLAANLTDKPTNLNTRFAVANKMNRLMTGEARPFWGAPPKDVQTWLKAAKPEHGSDIPAPYRHAEAATHGKSQGGGKSGAKTVWQLFGAGSVGGQAITGIPVVKRLRTARGGAFRVWPFETGWKALTAADLEGVDVVAAEVYPALIPAPPAPGEVKDQAQVRALCEHFAKLDETGKLSAALAPAKAAAPELIDLVEREEGWILGL